MATIKIRYLVTKPGAGGRLRYFWQPAAALRAAGFAPRRLSDDEGLAITEAQTLNAKLDAWRGDEAVKPIAAADGTLADLIRRFRASDEWLDLAVKTQRDYAYGFAELEKWSGDAPVAAITPPRIKKLHTSFAWKRERKDGIEIRVPDRPSKANALIRVLRLLLEYARRQGEIVANPALRPRLSDTARKGRLWSSSAIVAIVAAADSAGFFSIGTAILLNEWLGQREGDLLALPLTAWRGGVIAIKQSKTGAEVALPIELVPHLVARLEAELARARARHLTATTLLVCEATGRPWAEDRFRHELAAIRAAAATAAMERQAHELAKEIDGLWFMHLRHTAVTRLAEAGCELPMIAAVTGHSLETVNQIVDRYLVRTGKLARLAFQRRIDAERAEEEQR